MTRFSISRLSIGQRFALLGFVAVVMIVAGVSITLTRSYDLAFEGRRLEVKHLIEGQAATIRAYIKREKAGELTHAQAQKLAIDALRDNRFDGNNYFIVYDWNNVAVFHPSKELIGVDRGNTQDSNGKYIVREIVKAAQSGGGYVDYYYPKPGETAAILKVSYVAGFPEWNWALGTGLYVEDVFGAFESMAHRLAMILVPLFAVFIGLIFIMQRQIGRLLGALVGSVRKLADGDLRAEIEGLGRKDEIGKMAQAVATLKQAAIEKVRLEADAEEQRGRLTSEEQRKQADAARNNEAVKRIVGELGGALEKLSGGDLLSRIDGTFPAEYDKIRHDFNGAATQLQETMQVVSTNARGIHSGSSEMAQAADDLSRRTEQQAASLAETAAALDEIVTTVGKTTEGAKHARDLVSATKADAVRSEHVVRDAVDAMSKIEQSAQQITQIIGVIDEIAFQTNLLALNAGVEAARAGEAGRGFAVVASEVRALAQRSAGAAKEIKTLILASSAQVGRGVELVGETGKSLDRIVGQVAAINDVVDEIAASAQHQASGLQQVNVAIDQMDKVTQQNAAMVEESTAASHSLAGEAQALAGLIGRFKIAAAAAPRDVAPKRAVRAVSPAKHAPATRGATALAVKPVEESWEEF